MVKAMCSLSRSLSSERAELFLDSYASCELAQVKGYIRCKSRAMKALVQRMMKVRCAYCA